MVPPNAAMAPSKLELLNATVQLIKLIVPVFKIAPPIPLPLSPARAPFLINVLFDQVHRAEGVHRSRLLRRPSSRTRCYWICTPRHHRYRCHRRSQPNFRTVRLIQDERAATVENATPITSGISEGDDQR